MKKTKKFTPTDVKQLSGAELKEVVAGLDRTRQKELLTLTLG